MLLSKIVKVKWSTNNKRHFENLGYNYTKIGDYFYSKVEHLMKSSNVPIDVSCDYCGKEYSMMYAKYYKNVLHNKYGTCKCACKNCEYLKTKESTKKKYGVDSYFKTEEFNEIRIKANKKHNIQEIKELFENEGYELITTEYINNEQKLKYKCKKHGIKTITLGHFLMGQRCKDCFYENNSGENNNNWNGGTSELNWYLRGLLNEWKLLSLKKFNYKCCISGEKGSLEIHHDTPFKNIVIDVLKKLNLPLKIHINEYSKKELKDITNLFLKISYDNLGYPLTKNIHKEFHSIYGMCATKEDFWDFYYKKKNNIEINKNEISKKHIGNKKVIVKDLNIIFNSASELERKSLELFGIKFTQSCISNACRTGKKYKGFSFEYI